MHEYRFNLSCISHIIRCDSYGNDQFDYILYNNILYHLIPMYYYLILFRSTIALGTYVYTY